jgi:hypothetical protein
VDLIFGILPRLRYGFLGLGFGLELNEFNMNSRSPVQDWLDAKPHGDKAGRLARFARFLMITG